MNALSNGMPPEFFADARQENLDDSAFLKVLEMKDRFEERNSKVSAYSPDQFAFEYIVHVEAIENVESAFNKKWSTWSLVICFMVAVTIAHYTNSFWAAGILSVLLFAVSMWLSTVILDVGFDEERFFELVVTAAEEHEKAEADRAEVERRTGVKPTARSAQSGFDVPPQDET